jgi:hypothetical protein
MYHWFGFVRLMHMLTMHVLTVCTTKHCEHEVAVSSIRP